MKNFSKSNERYIRTTEVKNLKPKIGSKILIASGCMTIPYAAIASVESSLAAVQDKLVGTLLPMAAMLGLVIAGLSFVAGHANARQHLIYAMVGAGVGFGAESIISMIRGLIH
jgi:type IV secretory pathway VirB2 component (pilin)